MGEVWIDGITAEPHIVEDAGVKVIQDPTLDFVDGFEITRVGNKTTVNIDQTFFNNLYVQKIGDTMSGALLVQTIGSQFGHNDPAGTIAYVDFGEIDIAGQVIPYMTAHSNASILGDHILCMDSVVYLLGGNNTTAPKAKLAFIDLETPAATNIEYQGNIDTLLCYSNFSVSGNTYFGNVNSLMNYDSTEGGVKIQDDNHITLDAPVVQLSDNSYGYTDGKISSVVKDGMTFTIVRNAYGYISTITDTIHTWTMTYDTDNSTLLSYAIT